VGHVRVTLERNNPAKRACLLFFSFFLSTTKRSKKKRKKKTKQNKTKPSGFMTKRREFCPIYRRLLIFSPFFFDCV
jgi:hypothetical protein